jgi:hypothetical protein
MHFRSNKVKFARINKYSPFMELAFVTALDSSFAVYKHKLGSLRKIYRSKGKFINKIAIN